MKTMADVPRSRVAGIVLAFAAAIVSGVSVFVNGYGTKRFPSATVYTTAKNLVAALLLIGIATVAHRARPAAPVPRDRPTVAGLIAVGVIGGGVPFVLFFEGLARATTADAAFIQKTLVVWVALLAVPLLHERIGGWHLAAIGLLVAGQALLTHNLSALRIGRGETMIFAATLLWAVETVIAKRLLARVEPETLGVVRMVVGSALLVGWCAVTGRLHALLLLSRPGVEWALITGLLLAAYVTLWFSALARAQAVDVTAVLVVGAVITAFLDALVQGKALAPDTLGLLMLVGGGIAMVVAASRETPEVVRA